VVLSNRSGARFAELAEELASTLTGAPLYRSSVRELLPVRTSYPPLDPAGLAPLCGTYTFGESTVIVTMADEHLVAQTFSPDEQDSRPARHAAIGAGLFMSLSDGSLIQFPDENGQPVTRLLFGGHAYQKEG
jgi:hypothetical protein